MFECQIVGVCNVFPLIPSPHWIHRKPKTIWTKSPTEFSSTESGKDLTYHSHGPSPADGLLSASYQLWLVRTKWREIQHPILLVLDTSYCSRRDLLQSLLLVFIHPSKVTLEDRQIIRFLGWYFYLPLGANFSYLYQSQFRLHLL